MKYFYINIIIFCLFFSVIISDPIDKKTSLIVAEHTITKYNKSSINLSVDEIDIISLDSNNLFYIYHLKPQGFILVSADDRAFPILGYSFNNNFTLNNMPTNITWLINQYKTQ